VTRLTAGSATLVGQVRTANEDALLVGDELAVVADGMGGHRAGEVASADTVAVISAAQGTRSVEDLVASVHRANRRVNERAAEDEELRGMGTTVCVVGLVRYDGEEQLAVLNVGDSRVYLLAAGVLTQLTEDHSLVETLVREGRISAAEAEVHPQRNVLTRALGVEPLVVVDAWLLGPCDGDRLLLCSDGLFNELDDQRIAELLAEGGEPDVVARRLAAEAEAAGGRDNITTVVVDVADTGREAAPITDRYRRITTPAVDLSDPDDDGPHTDTVIAVVAPSEPEADDADASEGAAADEAPGPGAAAPMVPATAPSPSPDAAAAAADQSPTRRGGRWRTPLFILAFAAVILLAVGAVAVAARRGWFVGDDNGVVALFRGQESGVLWIQPTVEKRSTLAVSDLSPAQQRVVRGGRTFPTEESARRFIENLEADATTTTTTAPTTTTTAPSTVPTTVVLPTVPTTAPAAPTVVGP
jgi:serine/threonine protein phosphatase PrpC